MLWLVASGEWLVEKSFLDLAPQGLPDVILLP